VYILVLVRVLAILAILVFVTSVDAAVVAVAVADHSRIDQNLNKE